MSKLLEILTGGKAKPYGMIRSDELSGLFPGAEAFKCRDRLFVLKKDGELKLYDAGKPEEGLLAPASFPETDALAGFETELSFAPDQILVAVFGDGTMKLGEEEFEISVRDAQDKIYLVLLASGETILLDASRFLLYAAAGDEWICGYLEV
ncbi:MAG: hypothetical protein IKR59_07235 [Lachnospiraceae bacterium]|nr:hypothetical protein [Lachnospiraceae bacterium]